jgi:5-hydroxyisourate hydrolase-like protein (transthyretin family)
MYFFPRLLRRLAAFALSLSAAAAFAAAPITGVVTNKTTGKPSAGDEVTLLRLAQGMQESSHTKTDARGRFTLQVDDDGMHVIRVTHDKATYFHAMQPGSNTADINVYDSAPTVDGVTNAVLEYHLEAVNGELHAVEILQMLNKSTPPRTQFGPDGFQFYLPPDAVITRTGAITDQGMPIQTPAVPVGDPGHYKFLFPIRPGETQFGIIFTLPYSGSLKFTPKIATPVTTFAVLVPKSMKINPGPSSPLQLSPDPSNPSADTYIAQNVSPSQPLEFTVSGLGQLPRDADQGSQQPSGDGSTVAATDNKMPGKGLDNPLDPNGDRDVWGKYKWWILFGLAALLVIAAAFLVRKPATPATAAAAPATPLEPATRSSRLLASLKEEMFALETDRLQNRISESDYTAQKAALDLILRRALERSQPAPPPSPAPPSTLA